MNSTLTDLTLRVISGAASPEEREELRQELSKDTAAQQEFEELEAIHQLVEVTLPQMEAAKAEVPELPAYALESLHTARRQAFPDLKAQAKKPKRPVAAFWIWGDLLKVIFATGAIAVLLVVMNMSQWSDRTVEVGMYKEDVMRGGGKAFFDAKGNWIVDPSTPAPAGPVHPIAGQIFEQDAPFDKWKTSRLAWYQHGKIWVDNENNKLHIISRTPGGGITEREEPLAVTDDAQHSQIQQAVAKLSAH